MEEQLTKWMTESEYNELISETDDLVVLQEKVFTKRFLFTLKKLIDTMDVPSSMRIAKLSEEISKAITGNLSTEMIIAQTFILLETLRLSTKPTELKK